MHHQPLLATKLFIPPIRNELVPRPRLTQALNAGLARKLTLVSAPAGTGKTTLLSEWVAGASRRVAWLSLDEGDNDANRFWAYLVAALQTAEDGIGQGVLAVLQSPGPVDMETILTTLINEITDLPDGPSAGPLQGLILVLDDYHVIESPPIDKALTFLLDHMPPQMHLVIASRIDPTLPLSRLRARGHMTELRESDLRFTPDEVAVFMDRAMGLDLSAENVAALEARSEGWIAGLQLAALVMQSLASPHGANSTERHGPRGDVTGFINRFSGSDRYIQDYLADEVLHRRPKGTSEFLLQTSILDRLSGPLCDAVRFGSVDSPKRTGGTAKPKSNDSQSILESLDAANLFIVPLDNDRCWYRYHHLFADLLRQRLHQQQAKDVAELHIRASVWHEENGLEVEALYHAAAANDFQRAERLVEGDGQPLYHRGAVTPVLNWLESLPPGQLDARPSLGVMYAEVLMTRGRLAEAGEKYQAAEAILQDAEQDAHTRDLRGRIANGQASLAAFQRQPERMIALSHRALDLLHPDNLAIRAAVKLTLGFAYQLLGDRPAATETFAEAIDDGQTAGHAIVVILANKSVGDMQAANNHLHLAAQTYRRVMQLTGNQPLPYSGEAQIGLAQVLYEWNDLDAAQGHCQQGIQLVRQIGHTDRFIPGELLLARLNLARGDVKGATAILDTARQSVLQQGLTWCVPEIDAVRVLVLLHQGEVEAAARLVQKHELPISQALVHMAQGDAVAALAILDPLRQQMEAKGWQNELLRATVLQAVALQARGDSDEAVRVMHDALALAEPEGFVRTFVDEGAPMAQLLRQAAARGITPDYTAKLLAAFQDETKDKGQRMEPPPPPPELYPSLLVEPLSPRETEVLQLLAQGLSNREIGERLFLALSTVKGHNRNIFGKLQVERRTEAAARARELGLLER